MLAFHAESCQGHQQQSVLKKLKNKVEVHSVRHDVYVATETGGLMTAPCACATATEEKRARESAKPTLRCTNITTIIFRVNKQNRDG